MSEELKAVLSALASTEKRSPTSETLTRVLAAVVMKYGNNVVLTPSDKDLRKYGGDVVALESDVDPATGNITLSVTFEKE